jgi:CDGSH-type Zn-finger protein
MENPIAKIKVISGGPYVVTGNIPLHEKVIVPKGHSYTFEQGRDLPQSETYALCRCGKSKNKPFCDGTHEHVDFEKHEVASQEPYIDRADFTAGPSVDLLDDGRCAFARFCHREHGMVWNLVDASDNPIYRQEAVEGASACPTGRLTAVEKNGDIIEPEHAPSISIIQDPEKNVSAGIFVRGYIPIESADGMVYEIRNREALCRCGYSQNMPFCDATHASIGFSDQD